MSEKEGASSDEGNVPLKEAVNKRSSDRKSASKKKKFEKSPKKDSTPVDVPDESTSTKELENDNSKSRKKRKYYVEVEDEKRAVPLLDQPTVVEGSRQRRRVILSNPKPDLFKHGSIPIPDGKGVALGRIPTVTSRFKRLRLDEIKILHRFMFGKLGDLNYLNNNILNFNGFAFAKDSTEYARKLVILGKMHIAVLREFLLLFDLDLKIRKKEDIIKAILDFLMCPQRAETTANPNIVSHPKRRATKRNYFEREIEEEEKKPKRAKQNKAKENEVTEETGESSTDKNVGKGQEEKNKTKDEESKENNAGADNTNELKKPAKKRKRNQVIEEPTESTTDDNKSKKSKAKESNSESAMNNDLDVEVNTADNLSDDELRNFLKKVLADANLEKTTMKTVYSLISQHYPHYNFSKKKDFIKEVVKSAIQS